MAALIVCMTKLQEFTNEYLFYRRLYLYCGIAALIFLGLTVALFFVLKIPGVFGELTGRTAQRAIEKMIRGGRSSETGLKKQIYQDLIGENETDLLHTEEITGTYPGEQACDTLQQ